MAPSTMGGNALFTVMTVVVAAARRLSGLWPSEKLLYIPVEAHHIANVTKRFQSVESGSSEKIAMLQLSRKSLAGPGYIILNSIRVMNIIALLAVIIASVLMLVKTSTKTHLWFFDALSHVLSLAASMFLIVSEVGLFRNYFAAKWPLLSPAHGFVTLGGAMIALGIDVMGNLNKQAGDQQSIGTPFWRCVISSGIVVFILGFFNVIASFVFSDRDHGITARQVRADGAVALGKTPITSEIGTPPITELKRSYSNPESITTPTRPPNAFRIVTPERRDSSLPSYQHASLSEDLPVREPVTPSSRYSRATDCTKKRLWSTFMRSGRRESLAPPLPIHVSNNGPREMEISAPMGVNPQFAHLVQRPDSALHPSRTGDSNPYRWKGAI